MIFQTSHFLRPVGRVTTTDDGQPLFVGKDVARALGYNQPDKAIKIHTDEDVRMKRTVVDFRGRKQNMYVINESGLNSLILTHRAEVR